MSQLTSVYALHLRPGDDVLVGPPESPYQWATVVEPPSRSGALIRVKMAPPVMERDQQRSYVYVPPWWRFIVRTGDPTTEILDNLED